jgi:hypothetical protein
MAIFNAIAVDWFQGNSRPACDSQEQDSRLLEGAYYPLTKVALHPNVSYVLYCVTPSNAR